MNRGRAKRTRSVGEILRTAHYSATAADARRKRLETGLPAEPREKRPRSRRERIAECDAHVDDLLAGRIGREELPTEMLAGSSRALVIYEDGVAILGEAAPRRLARDLWRQGLIVFQGVELQLFERVPDEAVPLVMSLKRLFGGRMTIERKRA